MKVPISKIGPRQLVDVQNSTGLTHYNDYYRLCTVVKDADAFDIRHDPSPFRMAKLFGGNWRNYNQHFIVQAAGCPLHCPYCYVDNLKRDRMITAQELVSDFIEFQEEVRIIHKITVQVLHFMGGAPALYPDFWPEIRKELDREGQGDVVLFSDVVFVENLYTGKRPWEYLFLHDFLLAGCLKGVNHQNFRENTHTDHFDQAIFELSHYQEVPNFYLTTIAEEGEVDPRIGMLMPPEKIHTLRVVEYEVKKQRDAGNIGAAGTGKSYV